MVEEIRTVIEGTDLYEEVTPEMLEPARPALQRFIASWHTKQEETLIKIVRQSGHFDEPLTRESMLQATVLFKCTRCGSALDGHTVTYPGILNHWCNMQPIQISKPPQTDRSEDKSTKKAKAGKQEFESVSSEFAPGGLLQIAFEGSFRALDLSGIVFHEVGYQHTVALLSTLGWPLDTTAEELKANGPAVLCRCVCYSTVLPKPAQMRWPETVSLFKAATHRMFSLSVILASHRPGPSRASLLRML